MDGVTTISFMRLLNTTDRTEDVDLDRQIFVLWAIGGNVNNYQANNPNSIAYHAERSASELLTLCRNSKSFCRNVCNGNF